MDKRVGEVVAGADGERHGPSVLRPLPVCFAVATLEGFDLQAAGVAAPRLAPELGLGPAMLGLFFSAATFGLILGALLGGRVADLRGRKAALLTSLAMFGAFSVLTGYAWDATSLVTARFLTGLGLGGALPSLLAITAETQLPHRRAGAIAMLYAGFPTGGAIAALISLLSSGAPWRTIFLVGGVAPLLLIPLVALLAIPRMPNREGSARSDLQHLLGSGALQATLLLWCSFALALLVLYLLLNWLPALLVARGLSPRVAVGAQAAFNAVGALAGLATGAVLRHVRIDRVVGASFVALLASLAMLAAVPTDARFAIVASGLVGAAMVAVQAVLYALAASLYPPEIRGTGVGAAVAAGRIGSVVGPLLAGFLIAGGRSSSDVLLSLVPLAVVSGVAAFVLSRGRAFR